MLKGDSLYRTIVHDDIRKVLSWLFPLPLIALTIAFLVGVMLGLLGPNALAVVIGTIIFVILFILRQDELIATFIVAIHIYVDWYLGSLFASQVITVVLLLLFYLCRSHQHPWQTPRLLWLWVLYLVLSIYPAVIGALRPYDAAYYYPNLIVGALLAFWLGILVSKDIVSLQKFFGMLAFLGGLIGVHTLIQAVTGVVVFGTSRFDQFLAESGGTGDYELAIGSGIHRIGSFFVDPNFNGTFLAVMVFVALGSFVNSPKFISKVFYLAAVFIILFALLATYSNGAWIGVSAGFVVFIMMTGKMRYRILLLAFVVIALTLVLTLFPTQVSYQLLHASGPNELSLRIGAWKTGINVIQKYPWTGVGLGFGIYTLRAEALRDPAQTKPLDHPHNSYIELGAKAGLPVLIIFFILLLFAIWCALRNRNLFDRNTSIIFDGGIASIVALCVNSWSINAWTFPPVATVGWIILGALSSPLLRKKAKVTG